MTLLVFDLDFTLWDAGGTWCDHTQPPFRKRNGNIFDSANRHIGLYPDVLPLLDELRRDNVVMAIASRTGAPDWARELLDLFGIRHYFKYQEIYPATKTRHFKHIALQSGVAYKEMIFFDDESPNIRDVAAMGVTAIYVRNGITRRLVMDAMNRQ